MLIEVQQLLAPPETPCAEARRAAVEASLHAAHLGELALASGKSVRWVADQLGHASPMLTLKTYAHVIRDEEADLSFADYSDSGVIKRLYTSPDFEELQDAAENESAPDPSDRGRFGKLEHETGLEPAEALAVASSATAPPTLARRYVPRFH